MRFRYLTKYINKPAPPWTEPVLGRIRKDLSPYHHHWHGSLSDRQSNIALPRKSLRLSLIREQYFDRRRPLAHQHRRRGTVSAAAPPGLAGWLAHFHVMGKLIWTRPERSESWSWSSWNRLRWHSLRTEQNLNRNPIPSPAPPPHPHTLCVFDNKWAQWIGSHHQATAQVGTRYVNRVCSEFVSTTPWNSLQSTDITWSVVIKWK